MNSALCKQSWSSFSNRRAFFLNIESTCWLLYLPAGSESGKGVRFSTSVSQHRGSHRLNPYPWHGSSSDLKCSAVRQSGGNWLHNISSQNPRISLFPYYYFQSCRWSLFAWDTKPVNSYIWILFQTLMYLMTLSCNWSLAMSFFSSFLGLVAFVLSSWGLWLYLGLQSGSCDTSWDCSGVQFTQYKLSSLAWLWSCSGLLKGLDVLCSAFYRLNPAVGKNKPLWFTTTCASWATTWRIWKEGDD